NSCGKRPGAFAGRPTTSHSSATRAGDAGRRPSAICAPTFRRGLNDEYGFWNTSCSRTSAEGRARRQGRDVVLLEADGPLDDRHETDGGARERRLPAARLADEPDDPAGVDGQARTRDRAHAPAAAALVVDDDVGQLERAHGAASCANGSTGHASSRPPASTSGGTSRRQLSRRYPQRGWKAQPAGIAPGVGGEPPIATSSCSCAASGCGSASSSARVYGWRGRCMTSRVVPDSTTRPA